MPDAWKPLPLDKGLFANLEDDAIQAGLTAIENGFVNEQGGNTRFPGLVQRVDLGGRDRVYLSEQNGDMIAATSKGRVHRINRRFQSEDVTGVPVSGGRRVIFATTDRGELLMAAGGPIIRLRDRKTELLSRSAPNATHVQWIDGYTIATETNSGRFRNSAAGQPDQWDPLDSFAADGNPDNINSMIVTPFRELMLGGKNSIEQFERLSTGDTPFFRRWSVGDGVKLPYGMIFADNALWTVNNQTEFVRFSAQTSTSKSDEIGRLLEKIDDWSEAWIGGFPDNPLNTLGQKFILLQIPNATNGYGTKGVTLVYDYRANRYTTLYGWDAGKGVPTRWPGWSHWKMWDKTYVGGEGKVYELTDTAYRHGDELQRWLVRTAFIGGATNIQIRNFRLRVVRGVSPSSATTPASIRVRCRRDGKPWSGWISKSLGRAGDNTQAIMFGSFGNGNTFQFEISSADDCRVDLKGADVIAQPIGH
jgi:hypothetical protein